MTPREKFIDAMRQEGLAPANPSAIVETFGKLKRYQTTQDNPKNQSGYYILSIDGESAAGCFGSHREGYTNNWHTKLNGQKLTDTERQAFKDKVEKAKQEREAELEKHRQQAQSKANGLIKDAPAASNSHAYLEGKGISAVPGLKQTGDSLMVPVWNGGKIVGIQYISSDGDKKFLAGTKLAGSYFPIADKSDNKKTILICEGLATGITLREATGKIVLCAFNSINMLPVAKAKREEYPDAEIIMCGDNDQWTVKAKRQEGVNKDKDGDDKQWDELREVDALTNPGLEAARQAAHKVGGYVCVPGIPPDDKLKRTDFNDLYQMHDMEAVADEIGQVGDVVVASKLGLDGKDGSSPAPSLPSPVDESDTDVAASANNSAWLNDLVWTSKEDGKLDAKRPLYNAIIWLREHKTYKEKFYYNEFTHKTLVMQPLPWDKEAAFKPREATNRDLTRIKADLERYGMNLPVNTVKDAIEVASEVNSYNPVLEYFERLVWDGKPRLDNWLMDCCGAKEQNKDYLKAIGSKWLIGAAQRVYRPGSKFEAMLVFEGKQGAKKSTAFKTLATFGKSELETFFTDRFSFGQIEDKYAALYLLGKIIIEFQELDGLNKMGIKKIKGWISQGDDEVRKPFAATTDVYPRTFVIAGSTNEENWINDPTGGRRFWPVRVGNINIEMLEEQRDQLWAEAIHRYKQGEKSYIADNDPVFEAAVAEQQARYTGDVWDEMVKQGLPDVTGDITTDKILTQIINLPVERWTNREKYRIGAIMRSLGYESKPKRINSKVYRVWYKQDEHGQEVR